MARTVRDTRLDSRAARERLEARDEPYWRLIEDGCHLGYRKGRRGGRWIARYREPGAASRSYAKEGLGIADDTSDADGLHVLDFKQAQARAREWFGKAKGSAPVGRSQQDHTVADALDDYMAQFEGKSRAATLSRVNAILKPELGHLRVARLSEGELRKWLKARADAPARLRTGKHAAQPNVRTVDTDDARRRRRSTANRDFTVLKAALNLAFREGRAAKDDAWRKVKPFRSFDGAKLRYLTDAEAQRLVNAIDPEFRPVVQAALLTGARYGNLTTARARDLDPQSGTLTFAATKGGRPHHVYLEAEGVALLTRAAAGKRPDDILLARADGRRWGPSEQVRRLKEASARAGIERATFHDLRRSYGARLARAGVPMAVIAQALGHADTRITMKHYAHLAPSYVADTIRAHAAGLNIVAPDNVEQLNGTARRNPESRTASS